jgi:hypothetical protein
MAQASGDTWQRQGVSSSIFANQTWCLPSLAVHMLWLLSFLQMFPHLKVEISEFHANNGRCAAPSLHQGMH